MNVSSARRVGYMAEEGWSMPVRIFKLRLSVGALCLAVLAWSVSASAQQPLNTTTQPKPATAKPATPAAPTSATPARPSDQPKPTEPVKPAPTSEPIAVARAVQANENRDYVLGAGDVIRINVFDRPEMTTEARVSETGKIRFPLIGDIDVGGQSTAEVEKHIADLLVSGNYLRKPQVSVIVLTYRSQQISVLGQVNRPGRYPLEQPSKLSDMLAMAGGIAPGGSDTVKLVRYIDGKPQLMEFDQTQMFEAGQLDKDISVRGGDVIYVPRVPVFYIYGEVQRPGQFRVETNMTVMQALSVAGGITLRGTVKNMRLSRRDAKGNLLTIAPDMNDLVQPNDVIYVKESLF
jgi:polysaccharide biosynthesis/export protein